MKSPYYQQLRQSQLAYHRQRTWRLNPDGLYVPHSYEHTHPESLSWWDDVGFIHAKRRVMVWWQHPRYRYHSALDEAGFEQAGPYPVSTSSWLRRGDSTKLYRKQGASRKRVIAYELAPLPDEQQTYYDRLRDINAALEDTGIDFEVRPSAQLEQLPWAVGVSLIAPLEVRNEQELKAVADLARKLLRKETTLAEAFPDYVYNRQAWLAEKTARDSRKARDHAVA
jgi:hypothetical protein